MNILIIEDEAKTARELKNMIQRLDDRLVVSAIIPSVKAAVDWFKNNPSPQLILSDIQLADGLSFEIFRSVNITCPVIFCTAFDTYAIEAFGTYGIDYLLKPIDENKLAASLRKYEQMKQWMTPKNNMDYTQLEAVLAKLQPAYKSGILVFSNEKIIPVKTADIAFIHSVGGVVKVCTKNKQFYLINEVLDDLEPQLDPARFFRANRQYLVNRDVVMMAEYFFNRRLILKLNIETPEPVIISKMKAPELMAWMQR
ncbi:LytR/AlgR family response regulator transcription factor [Chitinophaga sp. 22620]|uniref:LytR/AlgR family response regulator transcription factor n=1 Tax=Chitinophaga sp. 22620 TaxID=3453952 RepID=UPI003F8279B4